MQTVIKRLESIRNSCARLAASGGYPNFDFEAQEAEYSKALSILRSYPGAVKEDEQVIRDEIERGVPGKLGAAAKPAEPLPTIYVGLDEHGTPWWNDDPEGGELAPDYVTAVAYCLLAAPGEDRKGSALCAEMDAALARWKSEKVEAGVELVAAYQVGMPMERKEADEPIAPEFTPPEMQDDPRFLKLLVATLETGLNMSTGTDFATQSALESATVTFNTLFPKP